MKIVLPMAGFIWIKEGYSTFRKRPFLLTSLFLGYLLCLLFIGRIPVLGQVLPMIIAPSFSMLFMHVTWKIAEGAEIRLNEINEMFTSKAVSRNLFILGFFYLIIGICAALVSTFVDGGLLWRVMVLGAKVEPTVIQSSNFLPALLVAAFLVTLAILLLWFVAPLIAWQKMKFHKAMFYSIFAFLRTWKAFAVYVSSWVLLAFLVPSLVYTLLIIVLGRGIPMIFVFIVSLVTSVLMYCSLYPSYAHVFGKPGKNDLSVQVNEGMQE